METGTAKANLHKAYVAQSQTPGDSCYVGGPRSYSCKGQMANKILITFTISCFLFH